MQSCTSLQGSYNHSDPKMCGICSIIQQICCSTQTGRQDFYLLVSLPYYTTTYIPDKGGKPPIIEKKLMPEALCFDKHVVIMEMMKYMYAFRVSSCMCATASKYEDKCLCHCGRRGNDEIHVCIPSFFLHVCYR